MIEENEPKQVLRDELKERLYQLLPFIDERLRADDTKLSQRAFHAAFIIVKEFVVEISGDDNKDDFAEKPWFAIIFHHVRNWYRETYGDALVRDHNNKALGVLLIRELPVEFVIPLTTSRVEVPNETAWLGFPINIGDDENPLDWLKGAPTLGKLGKSEVTRLRSDATLVATAIRSIQMNFMGIKPSDPIVLGLLGGVRSEFETAANKILRPDTSDRASALWTIHIAVERTLKALAQHKRGSFREIHNLFELFDDIATYGVSAKRNQLKKIPRDRDVINHRYGLRGTPPIVEVYQAYKAALSVVSQLSHVFQREMHIGGLNILLRKAPWITLPKGEGVAPEGTETTDPEG